MIDLAVKCQMNDTMPASIEMRFIREINDSSRFPHRTQGSDLPGLYFSKEVSCIIFKRCGKRN